MAIGSHIRQHAKEVSDLDWSQQHVCVDHAMLLGLQPLQELRDFLWVQLGLRIHMLEPYAEAQSLLGFWVSHPGLVARVLLLRFIVMCTAAGARRLPYSMMLLKICFRATEATVSV